ncbi:nucleoside deaminase [Bdellovibrio bacteriovorus]|uniref:Cytidine/deoxycytidylate deaminase family protein n=1 Tax=Bdellovibrio bacteriovorus str. Tiberius TaxID=1069642 RepID=K7ZFJ8_BDEBC|nr:nucleoside deaminase [Bdellovibrio bacteriovorus]AFY01572.1 cytidine/deoxycytidylate deaminase family protein [Bdellovibrio bacteriovorus str. Tiberius]
MNNDQIRFLEMAVNLAAENLQEHHGRPFGAVLVKNNEVIATGVNQILLTQDPTSHAELSAIRAASQVLESPRLDGCVIYASGQPCPMCLAAMHMTGIKEVYYALSNDDGEAVGLSTARIYEQMQKALPEQSIKITHTPLVGARDRLYEGWKRLQQKT